MRRITKEELNWLFTSPGCNYSINNGKGAHCALGKLMELNISNYSRNNRYSLVDLNNTGTLAPIAGLYLSGGRDNSSYDSSNPKEWNKHIQAVKLGLQYLQEDGIIEIEDEAAQEFGLILKKEEVVV